ncbi:unnamed protein product [Trichogramma brassicae]|uniref:DUF8207 domain-containing protein n=1 Tax=Trichogramma brassicae TaxID=86971 RepID=A0A6H5HWM9_9HYME|nr:unnamed protein product [Trichogramma brassicae]
MPGLSLVETVCSCERPLHLCLSRFEPRRTFYHCGQPLLLRPDPRLGPALTPTEGARIRLLRIDDGTLLQAMYFSLSHYPELADPFSDPTELDGGAACLTDAITEALDIVAPTQVIAVRPKYRPWCDGEVRALMRRRDSAYRRARRSPTTPENVILYRRLRSCARYALERAKTTYFRLNVVGAIGPRESWRVLRDMGISSRPSPSPLSVFDPDVLNRHFAAVSAAVSPLSTEDIELALSTPPAHRFQPFSIGHVSELGVLQALARLKSRGCDKAQHMIYADDTQILITGPLAPNCRTGYCCELRDSCYLRVGEVEPDSPELQQDRCYALWWPFQDLECLDGGPPRLFVDGVPIVNSASLKILGCIIAPSLSWNLQMNRVSSSGASRASCSATQSPCSSACSEATAGRGAGIPLPGLCSASSSLTWTPITLRSFIVFTTLQLDLSSATSPTTHTSHLIGSLWAGCRRDGVCARADRIIQIDDRTLAVASPTTWQLVPHENSSKVWNFQKLGVFDEIVVDASDDLDKRYGVYMKNDKFYFGKSPISFMGTRVYFGNIKHDVSTGLLELLFKRIPNTDRITENDRSTYKEILEFTNAHRKGFADDGELRRYNSKKFDNIIEPLFKSGKGLSASCKVSKYGRGLLPRYKVAKGHDSWKDFVYWNDPNELVDRLRLLVAERSAGNNAHDNEITSIIEELREDGYIY